MAKYLKLMFIGATLAVSANAAASESKYPCVDKIFEAVTANGQKEVRFCISNRGVTYTFGKVKSHVPELDIIVPFSKASYTYWRGGQAQEFIVENGNYTYSVRGGLDVRELAVTKNGREIAVIQLGKVIENNIYNSGNYGLTDNGI